MNDRPSSNARGYGPTHRRLRKQLLQTAWGTPCRYCGGIMTPDQAIHLLHSPDRSHYEGFGHAGCNIAERNQRCGPPKPKPIPTPINDPTRHVILICGPPGAGKTTLARQRAQQERLTVYDSDDPHWQSESHFLHALDALGQIPGARAVVIRSGATRQARARSAARIGATETVMLDLPADECIRRIKARKQPTQPMHTQIAAVATWWKRYEAQAGAPAVLGNRSRAW